MDFVVIALAVWRLTSLCVEEDGPFNMFARLRKFIGVRYDEYSQPYGTNVVAAAFTCMWCLSIWVGLFIGAVFLINNAIAVALSLPFALSAVVIIVHELVSKKE